MFIYHTVLMAPEPPTLQMTPQRQKTAQTYFQILCAVMLKSLWTVGAHQQIIDDRQQLCSFFTDFPPPTIQTTDIIKDGERISSSITQQLSQKYPRSSGMM